MTIDVRGHHPRFKLSCEVEHMVDHAKLVGHPSGVLHIGH
jgi:hypothetical protein